MAGASDEVSAQRYNIHLNNIETITHINHDNLY